MMYKLTDIMPKIILQDKNGYAICMAIDFAMNELHNAVSKVAKEIFDVDTMTEARLDEYAEENGILWYDSSADIKQKRHITKNYLSIMESLGTEAALKAVLQENYTENNIKYWYDIGGKNFEVIVVADDISSLENAEATIRKIDTLIPLRCKYSGIGTSTEDIIEITESLSIGSAYARKCGTFNAHIGNMEAI